MIQHVDSVVGAATPVTPQVGVAEEAYIRLLEGANAQFGIAADWLAVAVGVIAVLVAILTILSAFVIWRQGVEYRRLINAKVEQYRTVLDKLVAARLDTIQAQVDASVETVRTQAEEASGAAQKAALEEILEKWEDIQRTIEAFRTAGESSAALRAADRAYVPKFRTFEP